MAVSGVTTLVALGASNLTRGLATVVNMARRAWGEPLDVLTALGHGRSYGMRSRVLFRGLPSILECGLWDQLYAAPRDRVQALVTDIGTDGLYGAPPDTILSWIRECVTRLHGLGAEITITDLPLQRIRLLTKMGYLLARSVLFPSCRLDLAEALRRCEALDAGILDMAQAANVRVVRLRPEWYGLDPIHIRRRYWRHVWQEIAIGHAPALPKPARRSDIGALRLHLAAPQQRWLFGRERVTAQPAMQTAAGTRVWLY